MMKLLYSFILLLLSVSPVRAMEYVNGEPQGGGATIGSYEDVVALWTDCGSLFMKGDGTCGASSIVEVDPAFSAWDRSTGVVITTSQILDMPTYLTYTDITALWTDCIAGVLMADGTCVVLGTAANSDVTAFDPAGAAAAVIAASVTESDTTHCPDGASVFTALAGKQATGSYLTEETDPVCSAWAYTNIVTMWTTCTGYLKSDGTCDTPSTGATNFNDIGDATATGSIALAGYMQTITSTLNSAGANITMTNTTADLTADVSFMDLKLTDDGDANGYFLRGYDNAGGDLQWYIGAGGEGYFVGGITIPQSATAQSAEYYEGSGDGGDSHTISAQAMTADRVSYLPDYVIGFLASDQVDAGGDLADGAVDAVHINTIVESIAWNAAGTNSDGTQCADPAEATINSGPITYTTICADNDASTIYGHVVMPDSWDGGTVTIESEYLQTAADTGVLNGDIACMCRGTGETVNNTWGTEVAIDDAAVTGSNGVDMTTSAAITCDGTCAAGDTLYWRYQMDATGTTTAVATLHFIGWKMEYTSNVGD